MVPKPFDAITKADLDVLQANKVDERRTIEYKLLLPGQREEDKREFLADASSFANAGGGDLIYGVKDEDSVAVDIPGLDGIDANGEILRLANMLRTSIAPRMPGVQMKSVTGFLKGPVILLRIPQSWTGPHMVTFGGTSRFFTRNSKGKYQMDVGEIRSAFALSETLPEKIKQFRAERLGKIIAGETPVPLLPDAKLVIHVLPLTAFSTNFRLDLADGQFLAQNLYPLGGVGYYRHNLDGYLTYSGSDGTGHRGYAQLFRSGIIETVGTSLTSALNAGRVIGTRYEVQTVEVMRKYLPLLKALEVPLPVIVTMTWLGAKGAQLLGREDPRSNFFATPLDRDVALLPDVLVEDYGTDVPTILRPIFDAAWNACGYARCFNYDDAGKWKVG